MVDDRRRNQASRAGRTHGMARTKVYRIFCRAKERCENPNNDSYKYYGGRGIRFLWNSFEQFFAEMGHPPHGATLDRVNNDGDYAPGNCRWATKTEQQNNRRSNRLLTAFGRTQTIAQWARDFSISDPTLRGRLRRGFAGRTRLNRPPPRTFSAITVRLGVTPTAGISASTN